MKLYFAPPSPFARKIRIIIAEKGLTSRFALEPRNPFDMPADVVAANPLSKVPTLVLDSGEVLYDSTVIAEYVDSLGGPKMIPEVGPARWSTLRWQSLADGILEAGQSIQLERRRPESERSPGWMQRQASTVGRGLDAAERDLDSLGSELTIGHVALGCALGWLEFRLPDLPWRPARPKLTGWEATFSARASMQATRPT